MKREDDPQLWDLLGRAWKPSPSPFFARNVVRAVRETPAEKYSLVSWLGWRRIVPAVSIVAATLVTFAAVETFHHYSPRPHDNRMLVADGSDPDLVADLEELANDDDDDSAVL
jgi:hypothetical protein